MIPIIEVATPPKTSSPILVEGSRARSPHRSKKPSSLRPSDAPLMLSGRRSPSPVQPLAPSQLPWLGQRDATTPLKGILVNQNKGRSKSKVSSTSPQPQLFNFQRPKEGDNKTVAKKGWQLLQRTIKLETKLKTVGKEHAKKKSWWERLAANGEEPSKLPGFIKVEPTYRLEPDKIFLSNTCREIAKAVLEKELSSEHYSQLRASLFVNKISNEVIRLIKTVTHPRYKIICSVFIGQLASEPATSASSGPSVVRALHGPKANAPVGGLAALIRRAKQAEAATKLEVPGENLNVEQSTKLKEAEPSAASLTPRRRSSIFDQTYRSSPVSEARQSNRRGSIFLGQTMNVYRYVLARDDEEDEADDAERRSFNALFNASSSVGNSRYKQGSEKGGMTSVYMASGFCWNPVFDRVVSVSFQNQSLYATCLIFGVYHD